MPDPKTKCRECRDLVLQSTADKNGGRCKPCAASPKFEDVAEGVALGMRFLLGVFFGVVIGGVGYGIGSLLGTIGGIAVAIPFAMLGFIYGCFCVEINAIVRSILPFVFDP